MTSEQIQLLLAQFVMELPELLDRIELALLEMMVEQLAGVVWWVKSKRVYPIDWQSPEGLMVAGAVVLRSMQVYPIDLKFDVVAAAAVVVEQLGAVV